jgi:hypothetical protein
VRALPAGNNDRSPGKDKSRRRNGKRFVRKKAPLGGATLFESFKKPGLANAGAGKVTVALEPNPATAEQIGDGGNGFLRIFGAGAYGEDEIAQGESAWLKELIVFFHKRLCLFLKQIRCQNGP